MLKELIRKSRTVRRFYQDEPVGEDILRGLVDLARLSPSAANRQPLKYFLSFEPESNAKIFPHLGWAGYLKDWPGPEEGERPSAYIVVLLDRRISSKINCDHGIAAQSIMLGAAELGLGGTIIASFKKDEFAKTLSLPDHLEILLVLALGKPKEEVVLDEKGEIGHGGDVKYWRDSSSLHHVPKRTLSEIVIKSD
jgi:nitroreductase